MIQNGRRLKMDKPSITTENNRELSKSSVKLTDPLSSSVYAESVRITPERLLNAVINNHDRHEEEE